MSHRLRLSASLRVLSCLVLVVSLAWAIVTISAGKGHLSAKAPIREQTASDQTGGLSPGLVSKLNSSYGPVRSPNGDVIGYALLSQLVGPQTPGASIPVFGPDHTTLVGHVIVGQGFVPVGS